MRAKSNNAFGFFMAVLFVVPVVGCGDKRPSQTIRSPDWDAVLNDGAVITNDFGAYVLHLTNVANLIITSGRLVACDGFVIETEPISRSFPIGDFPVVLAVAQFSNDQRVACAFIQFSENPSSRWEFCGSFGVDSATGSYMDVEAAKLLEKRQLDEPHGYLKVISAMEQRQVNTWSWAHLELDEETGLNQILFSAGFGDGGYNCFVGFDEQGNPTKLVTDFQILAP